jgi:uncharacterized protein (DUF58 family)
VKEFELDPLADIWIVPDMAIFDHVTAERKQDAKKTTDTHLPPWMQLDEFKLPANSEEYMVAVAASLSQYFIRRDRAVGMMAYGQSSEILQPDRGERQMNRIFETLSVLRAEGQIPISDVMNAELKVFPRGTTVIVVTPTVREEWATTARQLVRRGLRVVTVLIDPESFGASRSSAALASLLQASGMVTYIVRNGDNLTATLSRPQKQGSFTTII